MNISHEEPLVRSLIAITKRYNHLIFEEIKDLDLKRYHFVLLRVEENNETLSQKSLSRLLNIDKSFMVSIIDHLCEMGYVRRERNENDRREQLIKLSDKAKAELPIIRNAVKTVNKKALKTVTATQLKTFQEVLLTIQGNLSDSAPMTNFLDFKTTIGK